MNSLEESWFDPQWSNPKSGRGRNIHGRADARVDHAGPVRGPAPKTRVPPSIDSLTDVPVNTDWKFAGEAA
jgi:hypothetical protein